MKRILLVAVIVLFLFVVGCTKNVYYTAPQQISEPTPEAVKEPTNRAEENDGLSSGTKGKELVKRYWQMYGKFGTTFDENDLNEVMSLLDTWNIQPTEIYMGSILFYGQGYGYLYFPDWDDDVGREIREDKLINLVDKYDGEWVYVFDDGAASFQELSDAEDFLRELWRIR